MTLAVLLDYYLMYLLALLSLRVWDDGAADDNLARLEALLAEVQGPGGSGQRFCDDAEALMLVATAHFELQERGYGLLLERVRTLAPRRRTRVALQHAAAMGCHLRFGFEATYARDTIRMRDDNVADYPWLCFAVAGAMDEYVRMTEAGERRAGARPGRRGAAQRPHPRRPGVRRRADRHPEARTRPSGCGPASSCWPIGSGCATSSRPFRPTVAGLLAAVVLLQLLAQRAQGHGGRRAAPAPGRGRCR